MVDNFHDRAVTYNEQMQEARNRLILENIIRSGYDLPLQFSDVSTVTGTSSAQGSIGASLPFFGPRAGGQRLFSFSPSFQASGGPSFNVSSLNTQEFFNGISAPIKNEIVANYVALGTRRETILFLTVAAIDFDWKGQHYHFDSDVTRFEEFKKFASVLGALIGAGLSFEGKDASTFVGPPLTPAELKAGRLLEEIERKDGVDGAKLELDHFQLRDPAARAALSASELADLRARNVTDFYRVKSPGKSYRFCLERQRKGTDWGSAPAADAEPASIDVKMGYDKANRLVTVGVGPEYQCGVSLDGDPVDARKPAFNNLSLTLRSVRGVFAFLGQLGAGELRAGDAGKYDVPVGRNEILRVIGFETTGSANAVQAPGVGAVGLTAAVAVPLGEVAGATPEERSKNAAELVMADESHRSVQLVSELMALYSSAKSLPTPNVIPIFRP